MDWIKTQVKKSCSRKQLYKRLPICEWLPNYNGEKGISDLLAGITVGLTVIPQGIAYAIVAKLPPQYGLYSSFMGCFTYLFLGGCKDVTVGPTSILALMTFYTASIDPAFVVLLTFLSGCIIMLLGFFKLGIVIDFISEPVISGFSSAAAIAIASGQVKSILGLEISVRSNVKGLVGTWIDVANNIQSARVADSVMGITCIIVLILMMKLKNVNWFERSPDNPTRMQSCCLVLQRDSEVARRYLSNTLKFISTGRNAIVLVGCSMLAFCFDPHIPDIPSRNTTFILTGNIEAGLPPFKLPPFSFNDTQTGKEYDFGEMVSTLGFGLFIIPLLAITQNFAVVKSFSGGRPVDASQELIALGACNLMGSFVSSMAVTGSFSRTAVNSASGVKTTFGGIYTGILIILTLCVLMPYCAYMPRSSLAAVIIAAIIFNVEFEVVKPMWRSKKVDLIPAFGTFFICLFWSLVYGILAGALFQVLVILYQASRPKVSIELRKINVVPNGKYLYATIDRALLYPSASYVRHKINKAAVAEGESSIPVVLDCVHINETDYTAAKGFKSMVTDFAKRKQPVIFYNAKVGVLNTFQGVAIEGVIFNGTELELKSHLKGLMAQTEEWGDAQNAGATGNGSGCDEDLDGSRQPLKPSDD